jgi:hypothetical protein
MFTNSWLPHSFTKNPSKKPFKFIHFNVGVMPAPQQQQQPLQQQQPVQQQYAAEIV